MTAQSQGALGSRSARSPQSGEGKGERQRLQVPQTPSPGQSHLLRTSLGKHPCGSPGQGSPLPALVLGCWC